RRSATIIKSAWRGEGRKTSAPKRATSKRAAAMDIISMAQQAKPKPRGQIELLRAQFTALSSVVKMMPSSSSSLPKSSCLVGVTCLPIAVLIVPGQAYFRTAWERIQTMVGLFLFWLGDDGLGQRKGIEMVVDGDDHVLLAVELVSHRRRGNVTAEIEMPEGFA